MTIRAKYAGRCAVCGGAISVGAKIEWNRGQKARHISCPGADSPAAPAPESNMRAFSRGQGYGGTTYSIGERIRDRSDGSWWVAERVSKTYIDEDGLSFGVGDESGYIYRASARPATVEEAAQFQAEADAREAKRLARKSADARLGELSREHMCGTDRPKLDRAPTGTVLAAWLRCSWVRDDDGVLWHIIDNGHDGDDWRANNAPGAVVIRVGPTCADELIALAAAYGE